MVMMASQYFVPAGQMAVARMGAAQAYVKVPETEKAIGKTEPRNRRSKRARKGGRNSVEDTFGSKTV